MRRLRTWTMVSWGDLFMRVLITGATGFLGLGLCQRLLAEGAVVRALVRPGTEAAGLEALGAEVQRGDLRRSWSLGGVARDVDVVVHAAAVHRGGRLGRTDFWQVNSEGTRHLLQEAVTAGVRRFVYVSSAGVLGDAGRHLLAESDPPRPADLYQITKLRGEQAVRRIAHADGIDAVILRPATIYGRGDHRFRKLFVAVAHRRFVMIGPWSRHVHFVHRDDVVEAIALACHRPEAAGETFLVAGPGPATMRELIGGIARAVGVPPPRLSLPHAPVALVAGATLVASRIFRFEPPIDPRRLAFFGTERAYRTDKLLRRLGFKARVGLDEGLEEMANWFREQHLLEAGPREPRRTDGGDQSERASDW
ncbi:MAG: NAD-dependent epimerase/dehydratase family protein [Candidatus Eiseniibacteriota bacterium]